MTLDTKASPSRRFNFATRRGAALSKLSLVVALLAAAGLLSSVVRPASMSQTVLLSRALNSTVRLTESGLPCAAGDGAGTAATLAAPVSRVDRYAQSVKAQWIAEENVTFVLQHDMNTSFFFVEDNPDGGIDPIRSFLQRFELNIRQLFRHLLYEPACEEERAEEGDWGVGCAVDPATRKAGKQPVVLDVGANRGYYALLCASFGHVVHAFDPQPHCVSMLGAAVLMNGLSESLHVHHAFVSKNASETMSVRKRTGCTGTFPNDNHDGWGDAFRRPLTRLQGADDEVTVNAVQLDELFNARMHDVLLMKVDVEGHEEMAMQSARRLVESGAVRNILMEFNLPMMRRQEGGLDKAKTAAREMVRWLMHDVGYASKASLRGLFQRQTPMTDDDWDHLLTLEHSQWLTMDAWFYRPAETRGGAGGAVVAAGTDGVAREAGGVPVLPAVST